MKEKNKNQKGFISIPIIIGALLVASVATVVTVEIVKHKKEVEPVSKEEIVSETTSTPTDKSTTTSATILTPGKKIITGGEQQSAQQSENEAKIEELRREAEQAKQEAERAKGEAEKLRKEAEEEQKEVARQQELKRQRELAEIRYQLEQRQSEQEELRREQERLKGKLLNYVDKNERIVINFLNNVEDIVITHKRNKKRILWRLVNGFNSIINRSVPGDPFANFLKANNEWLSFVIERYEEDINLWQDILVEGREIERSFYGRVSKIIQDTDVFSAEIIESTISTISERRGELFDNIQVAIQNDRRSEQEVINGLLQIQSDLNAMGEGMPSSDYLRGVQEWLFHQRLFDELEGIRSELQDLDSTLRYYLRKL